jgi:hypothetical protein
VKKAKKSKMALLISRDIHLRFRGFEAQRAGKVRGFEATLTDFCQSYLGLASRVLIVQVQAKDNYMI